MLAEVLEKMHWTPNFPGKIYFSYVFIISNYLNPFRPDGVSLLSIGSVHFCFGLYGGILIVYSRFDRTFCKLKIKTLIRRCAGLHCLPMSRKKTVGIYRLNH